jgi:uncharacterized membrane protein (UPF0127 family)
MRLTRSPSSLMAAAAVAIALGLTIYVVAATYWPATFSPPSSFTVNGKTFAITSAAVTDAQRQHGLMNTRVTNATIMLFVFPSFGDHPFWMYDTNTSLDMIWINATAGSGWVVYVVSDAQPCSEESACANYTPTQAANYVIEAKAGFSAANGISIGTTIQFG